MPFEDRYTAAVRPEPKRPHSITMEERRKLSISGVLNVESFDEREIIMETSEGNLIIRGEDLSISKLSVDNGAVNVQGKITDLQYEEPVVRQGFRARLFR